jgi:hypothetical protein
MCVLCVHGSSWQGQLELRLDGGRGGSGRATSSLLCHPTTFNFANWAKIIHIIIVRLPSPLYIIIYIFIVRLPGNLEPHNIYFHLNIFQYRDHPGGQNMLPHVTRDDIGK